MANSAVLAIVVVAFLVEALTEYFVGLLVDNVDALKGFRWALPYISAALGVIGAFVYKLDIVCLLANLASAQCAASWYGIFLTGLVVGRGSNFVHDLVSKFLS